ncbi:peptide/nickel transport system substrate-binding protein [Pseudoduganella lurida]|uniref:Peptide/nickel transport system substrate-binding protein n=1 Tax=Pseudoduganella lurida TaxID=1036180 RepID=A0A562R4N5_9BURK|nr:ABC transporter substrate-binding protein [Pseudoduganella lurida]TWI63430.1 peptide/nickel transport system substrate-binding protein [Pseudoduganella lurida]
MPPVRLLASLLFTFGMAAAIAQAAPASLHYPASDYIEQSAGRSGGVLHTSASYEAGSFDIHRLHAGNLLWQSRLVFDNLVYLDHAGVATPWLATSWQVSPDGRVYTFHLRRDVTFSDGTRFDAEAVRVNFERIKQLGTQSRISNAYLSPYREGVAVDRYTFEARLDAPYPAFLSFLAQTWLGFISPRQILADPDSIAVRPVGTGPFVLADYLPGKRAVLKRRADYAWAPDYLRHKGPAYLEGIVIEAVHDDAARTAALQAGQHQLTFEAALTDGRKLRADPELVFSNRVRPGSPMRSLAFNTARFPFDDVRIRRAAALTIDRATVTRDMSSGEFIPKADFLGTNTPGYVATYKDVLAYDPAGAARLLDAAGWSQRGADGIRSKDGRRLSAELLTTGDERTPPASVLAIQSDLKKAGIELRLKPVKGDALSETVRAGQYDALTGGWWSAATPDVLFLLYHGSQVARQNTFGQDTGRLADPQLDDLLLRARQSQDAGERDSLYRQAQKLLTELVPVVPLHESHHLIAYSKRLHGVLFDTTHNTPILTGAWLEPDGTPVK